MKTIIDESHHISQMATWKYVLYMGLTFTLLKVFYFYQTTSVTADVVSQFIAELTLKHGLYSER